MRATCHAKKNLLEPISQSKDIDLLIQNRIQKPDRAIKSSKMKALEIRRNQGQCVRLVFLIPAIYLLRQMRFVCERYRILLENPNRQKRDDCIVRTADVAASGDDTW